MGLREWQRGLTALIVAADERPPAIDAEGLSADERAWLDRAAADPGRRLTREAQRAWRRIRLTSALPLTMASLDPSSRRDLVDAYCDACPCVSFFHAHEGRAFAAYLRRTGAAGPHPTSLAALESAVADADAWTLFDDEDPSIEEEPGLEDRLTLHPAAARIPFAAAPEAVIGAVLAGAAPPPVDGDGFEMIVAPGVRGLGRVMSTIERRVLDGCERGETLAALARQIPDGAALARQFARERVLRPAPIPEGAIDRPRKSGASPPKNSRLSAGGAARRVEGGRAMIGEFQGPSTISEMEGATPLPRVLLVEDEPAARSALAALLEDEGFEVKTAEDGIAALEQLHAWTPDAVITDVMMPRLDGLGLMARLAARHPGLPVIVMTAAASVDHAIDTLRHGAAEYLPKPVDFDRLVVALRRVLARADAPLGPG